MSKLRFVPLWVLVAVFLGEGCCGRLPSKVDRTALNPMAQSLIRVNVARQNYSFHRPWQQGSPSGHSAIGIILEGPRVLVTSQMMVHHRYVELEKLESGEKGRAEVEVIDYVANLALLRPLDAGFLQDMVPLELTTDAVEGDYLTVLQVKQNGNIVPSKGPVTSIELLRYPSGSAFLAYRINGSLQFRFNNFTLPVLKGRRLAGLLMGYDSKAQSVDIVAAPLIEHFIRDASDGDYQGFPTLGVKFVSMADPQLRGYVGIPEKEGGVYIQEIARGGAGEKAGLKEGDVILEVAGYPVDRYGNYEHPLYGKVSLAHLIRCEFYDGERISLKIFREGKQREVEILPKTIRVEDFPVSPLPGDSPPCYYILGGLVIQELSLPYLLEYGSEWRIKAPISLVFYHENQETLDLGEREKIVFLSRVLRTSLTIGYEELGDLVITRINHRPIRKLEDVPESLGNPVNGFHRIEFEEHPKVIFVDPKEMDRIDLEIRRRYGLPTLYRLDGK